MASNPQKPVECLAVGGPCDGRCYEHGYEHDENPEKPQPLTDAEVGAIESRCNEATPGPWEWLQDERGFYVRSFNGAHVAGTGYDVCDSEFIATARADVPALIARIDADRQRIAALESRIAAVAVSESMFDVYRVEWQHCSPELLSAGYSCGLGPRRVCGCPEISDGIHMHDHLVAVENLALLREGEAKGGTQ